MRKGERGKKEEERGRNVGGTEGRREEESWGEPVALQ